MNNKYFFSIGAAGALVLSSLCACTATESSAELDDQEEQATPAAAALGLDCCLRAAALEHDHGPFWGGDVEAAERRFALATIECRFNNVMAQCDEEYQCLVETKACLRDEVERGTSIIASDLPGIIESSLAQCAEECTPQKEECPQQCPVELPVVECPQQCPVELPVVECPQQCVYEQPVVECPQQCDCEEPVEECPQQCPVEEPLVTKCPWG